MLLETVRAIRQGRPHDKETFATRVQDIHA